MKKRFKFNKKNYNVSDLQAVASAVQQQISDALTVFDYAELVADRYIVGVFNNENSEYSSKSAVLEEIRDMFNEDRAELLKLHEEVNRYLVEVLNNTKKGSFTFVPAEAKFIRSEVASIDEAQGEELYDLINDAISVVDKKESDVLKGVKVVGESWTDENFVKYAKAINSVIGNASLSLYCLTGCYGKKKNKTPIETNKEPGEDE